MKGKELLEKMAYVDNDLISEAENASSVGKSSHLFAKFAAVAACACLVAGGMLFAGKNVSDPTDESTGDIDNSFVMPDVSEMPVGIGIDIGIDYSAVIHGDSTPTKDDECFGEWHGKQVCSYLSDAMENGGENDIFAIRMYVNVDMGYVFNGKTLEQYDIELGELALLSEKLGQLLKEGEDLKYGEAICTDGNAEGVKWAVSYYNERVAYYGEELLSEYIADGQFLASKAEADYDAANAMALSEASPERIAYEDALLSYMKEIAESVNGCLPYSAERGNRYVDIFMTRSLFEELSTHGMPECWFDLVYKDENICICD